MERKLVSILFVWLLMVCIAGYFDWISLIPLPLFGIVVFLLIAGGTLIYFYQPAFKKYIRETWSLKHLMVFHIWRIVAGLLFLHYGDLGLLPDTFVKRAAYGDILAGLLVPVVLIAGQSRRGYMVFNVIGFVDFLLAVGTGLFLSMAGNSAMKVIETLPLVVIPLFGVPISGISHIMAFDKLLNPKIQKSSV